MMTTKHGHSRMNQRGFTTSSVATISDFGRWEGDRLVLDRRQISKCLLELDAVRSGLLRVLDKGGATAVFGDDGTLITVFNRQTFRRRCRRTAPTLRT